MAQPEAKETMSPRLNIDYWHEKWLTVARKNNIVILFSRASSSS